MPKYIQASETQCRAYASALAEAEGLPRRGIVYLGTVPRPDLDKLPTVYAPGAAGWTDAAVSPPVVVSATVAALEVPDDLALRQLGRRIGAVTLPARASLLDEASLAVALRTAVRDAKGLAADGTPKPIDLAAAQAKGG